MTPKIWEYSQQGKRLVSLSSERSTSLHRVGGPLATVASLAGRRPSLARASSSSPDYDYAFEIGASNIRFGVGVTHEVGKDALDGGFREVAVITDPYQAQIPDGPVEKVLASLKGAGVRAHVFDQVAVEPTDTSFREATAWALARPNLDLFISVGGGSVMDTAKAANLYSTYPTANFLDYVNAPIGGGKIVPGALRPHIAVPTTAGTGAETTGIAIFDLSEMNCKTGIASRLLKPTLAIVDPENTESLPRAVAAASGFDVLSHALESYNAIPYTRRPGGRPSSPAARPTYQGSNPVGDFWSMKALELVAANFEDAVLRGGEEARASMLIAATAAGVGFGSSGCMIPHALSYPVSSIVKERQEWIPDDYATTTGSKGLAPHGFSVVVHAPAVFEYTAAANPDRHRQCARVLGAPKADTCTDEDVGHVLADSLRKLMAKLGAPLSLAELGIGHNDIDRLVAGALPQRRLLDLAPLPTGSEEVAAIYARTIDG